MADKDVPESSSPDITGILLFEKCADLWQLVASGAGIVEQITQLRGVRLDLLDGFLEFGIAF